MTLQEIEEACAAERRLQGLKANADRAKKQAKQLKANADLNSEQLKMQQSRQKMVQLQRARVTAPARSSCE